MTMLSDLLRVGPGRVDLAAIDPSGTPGLPDGKTVRTDPKGWTYAANEAVRPRLADLQQRLYASAKCAGSRKRILLVLQAMDCGGKDGTIRRVAGAMNPLGLHIVSFGPPTPEEREHHFLWRIRRALPEAGYLGVFNRSHYEDVLIVRVHDLVPPKTWRARYEQINHFERDLVADGVTLIKVMLHISYEEQAERLLERLTDPTKYWKYRLADIDERRYWADYQAAYTEALERCSTDEAPWYVVPADRKWYRDWAVTHLLVEALDGLNLEYPEANFDVEAERRRLTPKPADVRAA